MVRLLINFMTLPTKFVEQTKPLIRKACSLSSNPTEVSDNHIAKDHEVYSLRIRNCCINVWKPNLVVGEGFDPITVTVILQKTREQDDRRS